MKQTFYIILLLTFTPIFAFSQDQETFHKNQLKVELLRFANFVNPGVELAYERDYLKGYLGTQISGTWLYTIDIYNKLQGYRFSIQQKWFFTNNEYYKKDFRPYFHLTYEYQNSKFSATSWFVDTTLMFSSEQPDYATHPVYEDSYNGIKTFHTVNIGFGLQFVKNHFLFEFTGGIGGKVKTITHFNRQNPQSEMDNGKHGFFRDESLKEGKSNIMNIVFQLKLGYSF